MSVGTADGTPRPGAGGDARSVLQSRVDAVLDRFVDDEIGQLLSVDGELAPVAEQLRTATAYGKRLRAAFCYWGWRAAGQPDSDALVRAAAAMELVHAAAVVHDDLIDDSPLRRGLPTAHIALRAAVTGRGGPRAARSLAMLVGDLLMAWAGQLFVTSGLPAAYLSRARPLWAALARELIAGECLEILRTGAEPDLRRSLKVIRYKTAKYTVEQPLLIGGALAGASPELREVFTEYGLPLGEAFQLRDDLLGLFGDTARTGKTNTDDLDGHRPTALLAETWSRATPNEREALGCLLGRARHDEDSLRRVRVIMLGTGAPDRVEEMIAQRVRVAVRVVEQARLPADAACALTGLAADAAHRRH
ncbi:polyprenyl synthetase family protein [Streptomyces sp. QHH-9511]|uniref:polyprenyl synthetase family protein n=1 Tax=Streptomyces sp. QHH-9511 TaxID=2684468 RepID=UPI001318B9BF|nr:polyprenyl synthetase family protein [Streptomyces sp. QHH-9511]QGZ52161.1 polyprenyl synthetase family protein [Streptomyces sp. QHH-9511]